MLLRPQLLRIEIAEYEIPSRNKTRRMHWAQRARVEQRARLLTLAQLPPDADPFDVQVDIFVTAWRRRPIDADNVDVKGIVDGLTLRVLHDDAPPYVRRVVTACEVGEPRVVVEIREAV